MKRIKLCGLRLCRNGIACRESERWTEGGQALLGVCGVFGRGGEQPGIAASRVTCHNTFFFGLRPIWAVDRGGGPAAHKW